MREATQKRDHRDFQTLSFPLFQSDLWCYFPKSGKQSYEESKFQKYRRFE